MRLNLSLLLLIALASALPVQAQPSPFANTPIPGADFLRSGEAEPDTTSPWRYFPLQIGDVWEYAILDLGGNDTGRMFRRYVSGDTLAPNGQRYFLLDYAFFNESGFREHGRSVMLRYDTLSARVMELYDGGVEGVTSRAPCPFDADFESQVECEGPDKFYFVTGGYDSVLDFEPDTTVTGVPYKTYEGSAELIRYAAGFGEVLYVELKGKDQFVLEACRVGGEAFGMLQYPVASEEAPALPEATAMLEAWPNPFREHITVALDLPQAGAARLEVVGVLGRVVRSRDLGALPPGRHEVLLRTADLAAGPYLVSLVAGEVLRATRTVTRLR